AIIAASLPATLRHNVTLGSSQSTTTAASPRTRLKIPRQTEFYSTLHRPSRLTPPCAPLNQTIPSSVASTLGLFWKKESPSLHMFAGLFP
ncbi:hypothetical protein TNCV_5005821, partial [Trichonephila clavipes]